ncbi:hypothetical protein [Variovorax sp. DT-64]|uniref:hypothetical protein n=1 Tax=Variovorax sp. DT-64 TaxID=3396160 RepID=UPI003F1D45B3
MAIDLAMTGGQDDAMLAQTILVLTDGFGYAKSLRDQMVDSLPTLCAEANSVGLDKILQTRQGQIFIAQAVVDSLSNDPSVSARKVISVFKLAHRVDLGTAFPSPKNLDTPYGRMLAMDSLRKLSKALAKVELKEEDLRDCTQQLRGWGRGWKLLFVIIQDFKDLDDKNWMIGAKAIDAAASDAELGGMKEGLNESSLKDFIYPTLDEMLKMRLPGGQLLLSAVDLRNFMRAVVSDKALTKRTLDWMATHPSRGRLYTAMARAIISFQGDSSFSRFNNELPVIDAVAFAAFLLSSLPVGEKNEAEIDKMQWHYIAELASLRK